MRKCRLHFIICVELNFNDKGMAIMRSKVFPCDAYKQRYFQRSKAGGVFKNARRKPVVSRLKIAEN